MEPSSSVGKPAAPQPPRLLDRLRDALEARHLSEGTIAQYVHWTTRSILFHGKRHPRELGLPEIGQFLQSIAQTDKDPVRRSRHVAD
jgi:hypothetical protein